MTLMGSELTQICDKNSGISGVSKELGDFTAPLRGYVLGKQALLDTCLQSLSVSKSGLPPIPLGGGGLRRKTMQPLLVVRGHLPKPICIHHLVFSPQEPGERHAISTHFVDKETEAESFRIEYMAQETGPVFAEHVLCIKPRLSQTRCPSSWSLWSGPGEGLKSSHAERETAAN